MSHVSRRGFLGAAAALALGACTPARNGGGPRRTRLIVRPTPPTRTILPGSHALGLGERRDGLLHVPSGYEAARPAPLIVMLHGAGGSSAGVAFAVGHAAAAGAILLAIDSRDRRSWDIILGEVGPDIAFLDAALGHTFEHCAVDPARIAIGGFSDGASYALTVGLAEGEVFTDILAFSPGFVADGPRAGRPRIFIAHGTQDPVLEIAHTSRRIVPALRTAGYVVDYREFPGGHHVPRQLVAEAIDRFAGRGPVT